MQTKIYFVRHARPDFSVKDDLIRPLSEIGIEGSKNVTKTLLNKDISAVYSSPFKRAFDTVKDLADKLGLEIITNNGFCERKVGAWVEDFRTFSQYQWDDFDYKLPEGESLREVQERNVSALFDVIRENLGKNVAIGTHGTALSTIINYYNNDFGYDDFWSIIDKMPYILCFTFYDMKLESIEEVELQRADIVITSVEDITVRRMKDNIVDYKLMEKWLSDAHVLEFYQGRDKPSHFNQIVKKYAPRTRWDSRIVSCIIEVNKQPIGYIQYYTLENEEKLEYGYDENEIIYGIDLFIGEIEYPNKEIGTKILKSLVDYIKHEKQPDRIVIDPRIDNKRAICCYEKCGFIIKKLLSRHECHEGVYCDSLLMELK